MTLPIDSYTTQPFATVQRSRRMFTAALATTSMAALAWWSSAIATEENDETFVCGTLPGARADTKMEISAYSARAGIEEDYVQARLDRFQITPYGTAFLKNAWLPKQGLTPDRDLITLGVCFLDGSDAQLEAVRRAAPKWLDGPLQGRVAFQFDVPANQSQIRVRFAPDGGNWSKVGSEALAVPKTKMTMNLEKVDEHLVLHEFGHCLGLEHEHRNPGADIQWIPSVVIKYMNKKYDWSEETTRAQILSKLPATAACVGDKLFNRESIMNYEVPASWTANHVAIPIIRTISERDFNCLHGLYAA